MHGGERGAGARVNSQVKEDEFCATGDKSFFKRRAAGLSLPLKK